MAKENIEKFYETVMDDKEKKNRLMEISQEYSGQKMDERQRSQMVEKHILPIAADMGLEFTVEELLAYEAELLEQKKEDGELSEGELECVAGGITVGGSFCLIFGILVGGTTGVCSGIGFGLF